MGFCIIFKLNNVNFREVLFAKLINGDKYIQNSEGIYKHIVDKIIKKSRRVFIEGVH